MGKLSKEAWKLAFFEVMKEKLPPDGKSIALLDDNLKQQKAEAGKALKQAHSRTEAARILAEDHERKRYAAGEAQREAASRPQLESGRASAQRDYDAAAELARESMAALKEARIGEKELAYRAKTLEAQIAEIAQRSQSKDFDGLSGELAQALMQAQLRARLEAQDASIAEADERLRAREEALADARRSLSAGEAYVLEGDVARAAEQLQQAKDKRTAIEALLPGFAIEEPTVSNTEALEARVKQLKGAAKASDEALAGGKAKVEEKQGLAKEAAGALEAAAAKDPELKEAADALVAQRELLATALDDVAATQDNLADIAKRYEARRSLLDDYAAGRGKAPEAGEVQGALDVIDNTVQLLAQLKGTLRGQQDAAHGAKQAVETARTTLAEAIEARAKALPKDAVLAKARDALRAAEGDLSRAEQAQAQASEAAGRVRTLADEAGRRLKLAQTLPKATETVGAFNAALKGVENTPIWDGSTALLKQLGEARFNQLRELGNKLTKEYTDLCDNGATMEELQAIYKDTPDLWKPPRFREEEKNWVAMKTLVDEETEDAYRKESSTKLEAADKKIEAFKGKLEKGETVAGLLVKGMKAAEGGGKTIAHITEQLTAHKELAEKAEAVLGLAAKLASVVQAPLKAVDSARKAMETDDPVEMLMLQDEFMASLNDLVGGLIGGAKGADALKIGGAFVTQIATLLPAIGVATSAAEAMKGMVDSAARIQETIEDAEAHEQAVEGSHRGEAAIDQFARRDKHLAARTATKTGCAMIKTAAATVDLTGVGVVASTAMKGVATGVAVVQTVAEQVVDRNEGEKARELLERAQAGDGHARAELFRYHPRYAKGILAIMASEGDALALRVLSTHGLDEAMIRRSSPKIVKRYLMKKFGESDTPPSWSSAREAIVSTLDSVAGKIKAIDAFFDNVADKLLARFDANDLVRAQAELGDLSYQLTAQADVGAAVSALSEIRLRRDALADTADEDQRKTLAAVDLALADELKKVAKLRSRVLASLTRVRTVLQQVLAQRAGPLRDKAEAAARGVLREMLVRVDRLAGVG